MVRLKKRTIWVSWKKKPINKREKERERERERERKKERKKEREKERKKERKKAVVLFFKLDLFEIKEMKRVVYCLIILFYTNDAWKLLYYFLINGEKRYY
jgi:hypothetical protein